MSIGVTVSVWSLNHNSTTLVHYSLELDDCQPLIQWCWGRCLAFDNHWALYMCLRVLLRVAWTVVWRLCAAGQFKGG